MKCPAFRFDSETMKSLRQEAKQKISDTIFGNYRPPTMPVMILISEIMKCLLSDPRLFG